MTLEQRIISFVKLGDQIRNLKETAIQKLAKSAQDENPWFTPGNVRKALAGISKYLEKEKFIRWTSGYDFSHVKPKTIGLVLAGNIPLVGFHDLLCVLLCGHRAQIKLSSKDSKLTSFVIGQLILSGSFFQDQLVVSRETLKDFDAVIATGSNNSVRHFEYYFRAYPHIIRKNRTSCAILTGRETREELTSLGDDVFAYFGLGCRNVSKLFVPPEYNFKTLISLWEIFKDIIHHHKYANNYDYQKSILLVDQQPFLDSEFLVLREQEKLVSPIGVLYYEHYESEAHLKNVLLAYESQLQCVVGHHELATVNFGASQYPEVWDYADGVDTLRFLTRLD